MNCIIIRKIKFIVVIVAFVLLHNNSCCQLNNSDETLAIKGGDTIITGRLRLLQIGGGSAYLGVMGYLSFVWYRNVPPARFHWFDDSGEWKQVDKIGHCFGAYLESILIQDGLEWAGFNTQHKWYRRAAWAGFLLQLPIEILDGFSADWGASWADIIANATGTGIILINQAVWKRRVINLKFSFWPSPYAKIRPELLGKGATEIIKDYNGQTYWLSTAPGNWVNGTTRFPKWVAIAFGYGANGMIGGYGREPQEIINKREFRQWFFSLDIDWSQFKPKNKFLKWGCYIMRFIKIPAPAFEISRNYTKFHWVYF